MDERLKVAVSEVLIAAMFAFGAGGNWLAIQETALAIPRGRNWPRCWIPAGTFKADLRAQRRRCERKFSTVLMAANVTRQVRQNSL